METKKPARPYGQNKQAKHFRLTPETVRRLKEATAQEGVSETVYVELALKDRFKRDGIK